MEFFILRISQESCVEEVGYSEIRSCIHHVFIQSFINIASIISRWDSVLLERVLKGRYSNVERILKVGNEH